MRFAEPLWLLALALLPLLWWLDRRPPPLPRRWVAGLFLWREAALETDPASSVRRPPRDPWRLVRRMGLLAAIFLALARPELGGAGPPLLLVVDVSASMAARATRETGGRSRLAAAVAAAAAELEGPIAPARARLIAAGPVPRLVGGWGAPAEIRGRLAELAAVPGSADLPAALALARSQAKGLGSPRILLVSDAIDPAVPPAGPEIEWRRVGESVDNAGIVAFALRAPPLATFETSVFVEVLNAGASPRRGSLELSSGGRVLWQSALLLAPGERRAFSPPLLRPPAPEVVARWRGGTDALALDDEAFAVAGASRRLRLLWVSDGRPFVSAALALHPGFEVGRLSPAAYRQAETLPEHEVRVLDGRLPERTEPGGILVFLPGEAQRGTVSLEAVEGASPVLLAGGSEGRTEGLTVSRPAPLSMPEGARVVLSSSAGAMAIAFERNGRREVRLGFDPEAGGFAHGVVLPILLHRAIEWLADGGAEAPERVMAGEDWTWRRAGSSASPARIEPPGATPYDVASSAGQLVVSAPTLAGVWRAHWAGRERAFAVSLLDAAETELKVAGGPMSSGPRAPGASGSAVEAAPRSRDESPHRADAGGPGHLLWGLALALLAVDTLATRRKG